MSTIEKKELPELNLDFLENLKGETPLFLKNLIKKTDDYLDNVADPEALKAKIAWLAPMPVAFYNNDLELVWVNKVCEDITGRRLDEMVGESCYSVWGLSEPCEICPSRNAIRTGKPSEAELTSQNHNQCYKTKGAWFAKAVPVFNCEGEVIGAIESAFDITKRKQAEDALQTLNETLEERVTERTKVAENHAKKLQALVGQLTVAENKERERLAKFLHDDIQQLLIGAKIHTEVLIGKLGEEKKQVAETVLNLIQQAFKASRTLTAEISCPVLAQGVNASLEWLCSYVKGTLGLAVRLETDSSIGIEHEDITVFIYQAVRELLLNIAKHSSASTAMVQLTSDSQNNVKVHVSDDGSGFDNDLVWKKASGNSGFGLHTINERLQLLGGNMKIESSPGKGSTFTLIIPLQQ